MEEKLKSIFKGAGTRQGCPLSLFLFKAVTDASARTLSGRDEEMKGVKNSKYPYFQGYDFMHKRL